MPEARGQGVQAHRMAHDIEVAMRTPIAARLPIDLRERLAEAVAIRMALLDWCNARGIKMEEVPRGDEVS